MKVEINSKRWMCLEDLPGEEWRVIDSLGNQHYFISNFGRVKNEGYYALCKNKNGVSFTEYVAPAIKTASLSSYGYYMYSIMRKRKSLHRLLAEAFIPNPENKTQIDHINTIRTDNRIENLRWVTCKENHHNPITESRYTKSQKRRMKSVVLLDECGNYVAEYDGIKAAARELNVSTTAIQNCIRSNRMTLVAGHMVVLRSEYGPNSNYVAIHKKGSNSSRKTPSKCTIVELRDGHVSRVFKSLDSASKYYGASRTFIYQHSRGKYIGEPQRNTRNSRLRKIHLSQFQYLDMEQQDDVIRNYEELLI